MSEAERKEVLARLDRIAKISGDVFTRLKKAANSEAPEEDLIDRVGNEAEKLEEEYKKETRGFCTTTRETLPMSKSDEGYKAVLAVGGQLMCSMTHYVIKYSYGSGNPSMVKARNIDRKAEIEDHMLYDAAGKIVLAGLHTELIAKYGHKLFSMRPSRVSAIANEYENKAKKKLSSSP
jgi:hypothetical protein